MIISEADLEQNVALSRNEIISSLVEYVQYDTILFFSENEELSSRQEKLWRPYINWFNQKAKASFIATKAITIPQKNLSQQQIIAELVSSLPDEKLKALYVAAKELRSVILAFYLIENRDCDVVEIFESAFLEQEFQEEFWGETEASRDKYTEILNNLNTIKNFLKK